MTDPMIVTVTDVHPIEEEATILRFDGISDNDASDFVTFEKMAYQFAWVVDALATGSNIKLSVTPGEIIWRQPKAPLPVPAMSSEDFQKVAEKMVNEAQRIDENDAKIMEQIQSVARAVAEHDAALSMSDRKSDKEIWNIAQRRRGSEAELNRLLMQRINTLATRIRESGIYD